MHTWIILAMLQKLHPKPYTAIETKLQDYSFWYLLSVRIHWLLKLPNIQVILWDEKLLVFRSHPVFITSSTICKLVHIYYMLI